METPRSDTSLQPSTSPARYWAFVSYSRSDERWARWVHRSLERYRLPSKLVGTEARGIRVPKRLFPVFRDRDELPGSADLGQALKNALANSHALIVICSPSGAASQWVNEEIRIFKTLGRGERIQYLIVAGEPNATDAGKSSEECLPEAARFEVTRTGELTQRKVEPLAADIREHADGKLNAKLKLVAGILGLDFDQLKRRDRRRRVASRIKGAAAAIAIVSTGGGLWYGARRDAHRQEMIRLAQQLSGEAQRQLDENNQAERALLLAVEAYRLSERYGGTPSMDVERGLRHVLGAGYFSVALAADGAKLTSVAFSPSGTLVAASGSDFKIRIWEVATKNPEPRIVEYDGGVVWSVMFSPDSKVLAGGVENGRVGLWTLDSVSGPVLLRASSPADAGRVTSIAYDPTGRLIAAASYAGPVYVWDLQSPDTSVIRLCCHDDGVRAVAFHPANRGVLASGGGDRTVRLWDLRNPSSAFRTLRGATKAVHSLAFSPGGRWVAAGTDRSLDVPSLAAVVAEGAEAADVAPSGGNILLWNLAADETAPLRLEGHEGSVLSLLFAGDGSLISAAADQSIRIWNVASPDSAPVVLRGHTTEVMGLALSRDARTLASAGGGEWPLRLWGLGRPAAAPATLAGHESSVRSVAFSPSGDTLATAGSTDASIRLWRLDRLDAPPTVVDNHHGSVVAVAYDPKGRFVATGAESLFNETDNTLRIFRLPRVDSPVLTAPHSSSVLALAFGAGGSYLLSAGRFDEALHLWDLSGSTPIDSVVPIPSNDVLSLVANPRDRRVVWGTADGELWFWDLDDQRVPPVPRRGHRGPVHALAAAPGGKVLVSGGEDRTVRIWNWDDPSSEATLLAGHEGPVYGLAVDLRGTQVVSASGDGTVRVWSVEDPQASPIVFYGSTGKPITFNAVALSSDDRWVAAGANDKTIRLWPRTGVLLQVACSVVWRNLTEKEWRDHVGEALSYRRTCDLRRSPS